MRKLIVLSFISLDGIMQAPGGPEEDLLEVSSMKVGLPDTLMTFLAK